MSLFQTISKMSDMKKLKSLKMLTNQFHKWSHQDSSEVPTLILFLQRTKLIMSVSHHQIHHTSPHDTHYCITSGWLNRGLDAIGFWTRAEALIERFFKVKPYEDQVLDRSLSSSLKSDAPSS